MRAEQLTAHAHLAPLAERLGHLFNDPELLQRALCHRSWCAENPGHESNERLEFLGDAVLGLVVAEHVYCAYPDHDEGWLSRARSTVVRASALADMAGEFGLGQFLRLGKGEAASGGRDKTSILADAMEAVIGSVYLDGGWPDACRLVLDKVEPRIAMLPGSRGDQDHKSILQEVANRDLLGQPSYLVAEHGPEHHKTFEVTVMLAGRTWGQGSGPSKKRAEQVAASETLTLLRIRTDQDPVTTALLPSPQPKDPQDA